ncbi:MAG: hypothetical protein HY817_04955 [Candidatus Abawacabacteria bacterium]|nr:hypothetical protein [Candidatus Abawacabacteria bacterium]
MKTSSNRIEELGQYLASIEPREITGSLGPDARPFRQDIATLVAGLLGDVKHGNDVFEVVMEGLLAEARALLVIARSVAPDLFAQLNEACRETTQLKVRVMLRVCGLTGSELPSHVTQYLVDTKHITATSSDTEKLAAFIAQLTEALLKLAVLELSASKGFRDQIRATLSEAKPR